MNSELTRREEEILIKVITGFSDQEIADMLYISFETVRTHGKHIRAKAPEKWPDRMSHCKLFKKGWKK